MDYDAYAIWWVPRPGTGLARFGAAWTGWCADSGIVSADGARAAAALGHAPGSLGRRGLHASLRSAFRLAPGCSRWALEDALAELAERTEAVRLPALELTVFDGRVVLAVPDGAVARLAGAVADAVRRFALPLPYAASQTDGASPADEASEPGCPAPSLDRFHLPLTDRMDLGRAYEVVAELRTSLAPVLARRQRIDDLAIVGDPGEGRPWRLLQRHQLAGDPARGEAPVPSGMAWRGPSLLAPFAARAGRATA